MSDIINWLKGIEASAANLYAKAAVAFRDDKDFSRFLSKMAGEEKQHEKFLQQASSSISANEIKRACFNFDEHFRHKVEAPFTRAWRLLQDGNLTKDTMVALLVEAEFSEWNEVFLYTLDLLKIVDEDMQKAVSDVDQHRQHIQEFISSLPGGDRLIQKVGKQSQPGRKRVLIVENNLTVARMLEALAGDQVDVIIARDGCEGGACLRQGHFDLIVSEIELPNMNGIEMYQKISAIDPSICSRFIFFTGSENSEHLNFVRVSKILMLPKPSPVKLICEMMNDVLDSNSAPQNAASH